MTDPRAPDASGGVREIDLRGKQASTEPDSEAVLIGARIRDLRKRAGLSLIQLGEKVGRTNGFLSLVENGRRTASYLTQCRIAIALGISVDELLDVDEKVSS
jgi:ribosome-binding protein aMBF1 (putative translation factor)